MVVHPVVIRLTRYWARLKFYLSLDKDEVTGRYSYGTLMRQLHDSFSFLKGTFKTLVFGKQSFAQRMWKRCCNTFVTVNNTEFGHLFLLFSGLTIAMSFSMRIAAKLMVWLAMIGL
jgi:hypothetical protein